MSCYANFFVSKKKLDLVEKPEDAYWGYDDPNYDMLHENGINIVSYSRSGIVGYILCNMFQFDTVIEGSVDNLKSCIEELNDEKHSKEKEITQFYETIVKGKIPYDEALEENSNIAELKEDAEYIMTAINMLEHLIDCIKFDNAFVYVTIG